jgi:AcrR family transcriptional regulator
MTESPSDSLSKGERTRQIILETAYALFIEQGFHGTSMRQIARRAGIALGGIYNHFSSKEQIFDAVLLENHPYRQVLQILQAAPGNSAEEFAHNAAKTIVAELGKRPDFLKLAFIEFSEFRGVHAPLLFRTIVPQVLPLLQRFKGAEGQLRDLPPHIILLSFLGIFFAYFLTESVHYPELAAFDAPGNLDRFLEIYLHGILKSEQP